MEDRKIYLKIFKKLLDYYGPRNWWPARSRFEIIAGAILTQNVSWNNAKTAVDNLKKSGLLSPRTIISSKHEVVADKIKTSRFYNQKAKKLKIFCNYLIEKYNGSLNKMFAGDTECLRRELLNLKGIGEETADSILLYAGSKLSFVSDAYTKRLLGRYGLLNGMKTYDEIRKRFMDTLPQDSYVYNEYHALIVHHGYTVCKAVPNCADCPIRRLDRKTLCLYSENFLIIKTVS